MEICAIVVAFDPDQRFSERLDKIGRQADGVVIIDNSPSPQGKALVDNAVSRYTCPLIRNETNAGLGKALNQGIAWAKENGHSHVLLFDQDSTPHNNMVQELRRIWRQMGSDVAILGSNFLERRSQRQWLPDSCPEPGEWQPVPSLTTSGMLLPIATVERIGMFCESLFVDLVDMEFSLRARSRQIPFGATCEIVMTHEVGNMQRERIFRRVVWPSHHSVQRRYYMARNTVVLLKRYGRSEPRWALSAVLSLVKSLILVSLFEKNRGPKFRATMSGLADGAGLSTDGYLQP
jgi:rhamnosyltransferase